jgi:hypothetical protein
MVHDELYHHLRFSPEEVRETRDGLDVQTLGLPPGAGTVLRFLRPWSRMQWMNRLRLTPLLARSMATVVRHSGALGILSVPAPTNELSLDGGRLLQRIWLAAEAQGLALQPLGSAPVFFGHVQVLDGQKIPADLVEPIQRIIDDYYRLVSRATGRIMLIPFRIGIAPRPEIQSLRRPAEEVLSLPSTCGTRD